MVVVLLSVIAGIALPRIDYVSMRLDADVRTMRGVFQQAWRLSIQKQHDVIVSVDSAGRRVRILEDINNDGVPSTGERITWRPLEEGVVFDVPPTGVTGAVTKSVSGPGVRSVNSMPSIAFHRNGASSGNAELYMSAAFHGQKEYRAITIAQATGRADWYKYVKGSWKSGGM